MKRGRRDTWATAKEEMRARETSPTFTPSSARSAGVIESFLIVIWWPGLLAVSPLGSVSELGFHTLVGSSEAADFKVVWIIGGEGQRPVSYFGTLTVGPHSRVPSGSLKAISIFFCPPPLLFSPFTRLCRSPQLSDAINCLLSLSSEGNHLTPGTMRSAALCSCPETHVPHIVDEPGKISDRFFQLWKTHVKREK